MSDSDSLRRIERQIRELRAEPMFAVRHTADILDQGVVRGQDYVEHVEGWDELHDLDRFSELARLDWRGVGPEDRHRLLERELDVSSIPPAMMLPFLHADNGRPLPGGPPLPSPAEIANGRWADGPEQADDQERGNVLNEDHRRGR